MKSLFRIFALMLLILAAGAFSQQATAPPKPAEQPKAAPKKDEAPTVPLDLQRDLFKASADQMSAQHALEQTPQWIPYQQATDRLRELISDLTKVCGVKFHPGQDRQGYPICVPVEEHPAPTTPKK